MQAFTSPLAPASGARPRTDTDPVKFIPVPRPQKAALQSGNTLGNGMDFALVILVFVGIGALLDRAIGTWPWCTVSLVIIGFVGQFARLYYAYTATMERLEAERRDRSASTTVGVAK